MQLGRRKPSGREKNEAAVKLLERLREQLHSSNPSTRRQAAFCLSWMQEDGLEILQEALFSRFPIKVRNAAAYGLRKMRGRMKKMALQLLRQGLRDGDIHTKQVCKNALLRLGQQIEEKLIPQKPPAAAVQIKEIPAKTKPKRRIGIRQTRPKKIVKKRGSF